MHLKILFSIDMHKAIPVCIHAISAGEKVIQSNANNISRIGLTYYLTIFTSIEIKQ